MPRRKHAAAPVDPPVPVAPHVARTLEMRRVPIADIQESPLNPRRRRGADEDADLDDLVASIRAHDVIEPIVLREVPGAIVSLFEVVAGSRRFRAARIAGLRDIPATFRQVSDQELLELALAENVHRKTMHPLDEAAALADLQQFDRVYLDLTVLAAKVGRSATYVRDRLRLRNLAPLVVEALDAGAVTLKHAELIATAAPDQHARALEECFVELVDLGEDDDDSDGMMSRAKAIVARKWSALRDNLRGTRDLADWLKDYAKQDVKSDAVQEVLRPAVVSDVDTGGDLETELARADEALEVATESYLQLSDAPGYALNPREAKAAGVISKDNYKVITSEKNRCRYAKRGVIVHPSTAQPRVLEVCASRICSKHYPKPTHAPSGRPAGVSPAEKQKRERAAAEQKRKDEAFDAARPQLIAAIVKHVVGLKLTAKLVRQLFGPAQWFELALRPQALTPVEKFVKLTDASAFAVFLLAGAGLDSNSGRWLLDDFATGVGFDLDGWVKKHAQSPAPEKPAAKSAKKPAVKKGAKKR